MAFNINQFGKAVAMAVTPKIAMAQQPLPAGWAFSYLNDGFEGPNGEFISRSEYEKHGSFHKAFAHMYGAQMTQTLQQSGSFNISNMTGQEKMRISSAGQLGVAASIQPASEITVQGKLGTITINLDTGDLKMPPNVGRDAAIRDFWLGFQENFQPTNKAKYEQQIKDLQLQVAQVQASAALMKKDDEKEGRKKVAERIAKKYNGEKFIMVKPEDLIRFIEAD